MRTQQRPFGVGDYRMFDVTMAERCAHLVVGSLQLQKECM
jgi:hypothetical protein